MTSSQKGLTAKCPTHRLLFKTLFSRASAKIIYSFTFRMFIRPLLEDSDRFTLSSEETTAA